MKQLSDSCHDETNKKPLYATGGVWLMKDPVVKRSTYKQAASRSSKATASYIRLLKSLGLDYQIKADRAEILGLFLRNKGVRNWCCKTK